MESKLTGAKPEPRESSEFTPRSTIIPAREDPHSPLLDAPDVPQTQSSKPKTNRFRTNAFQHQVSTIKTSHVHEDRLLSPDQKRFLTYGQD